MSFRFRIKLGPLVYDEKLRRPPAGPPTPLDTEALVFLACAALFVAFIVGMVIFGG